MSQTGFWLRDDEPARSRLVAQLDALSDVEVEVFVAVHDQLCRYGPDATSIYEVLEGRFELFSHEDWDQKMLFLLSHDVQLPRITLLAIGSLSRPTDQRGELYRHACAAHRLIAPSREPVGGRTA